MTTHDPSHPDAPTGLFELLDETHRAIQRQLAAMGSLVADFVASGAADAALRERARVVLEWFDREARQHHLDEETHVFPRLLESDDPELVQHIRRLSQDHGWIEEDWLQLQPMLSALASGQGWVDASVLEDASEVFSSLVMDHLQLEEAVAYPAARAAMQAPERQAGAREMERRRKQRELSRESGDGGRSS